MKKRYSPPRLHYSKTTMTIKDNYRQEPTPSTTLHSSLIIYPLSFLFVLLFTTCDPGDPAVDALHRTADSLMAVGKPDSALQLLHTLDAANNLPQSGEAGGGFTPSRRQLMRHELLRAKAMNKAYVDFTVGGDLQSPDSVMRVVADYYDRHGTPNERMEAHYLLGCTYRDMGEAPRAIDCYLDAAACADTTAKNCDYYTLASIYAQMAKLYHQRLWQGKAAIRLHDAAGGLNDDDKLRMAQGDVNRHRLSRWQSVPPHTPRTCHGRSHPMGVYD